MSAPFIPANVQRYILIRPGALGDALLALPALSVLRRARPQAHITLVARADVLPLAQASGLADAVSPYDAPTWAALFAGDPDRYDAARAALDGARAIAYIADPDGLVRANLTRLGAARALVLPGRPPAAGPHAALHVARALAGFDIPVPSALAELSSSLPRLAAPPGDEAHATGVWRAFHLPDDRPVLALHPGSGGEAKRWPPERFAQIAREAPALGLTPLLLEGPADAPAVAAVASTAGVPLPVARDLGVGPLLALLRRCAVYLGNDSGVTHLAAFAVPRVVALFGPTDPALWSPLSAGATVLRSPTARMDDIPAADVLAALRSADDHTC